MFKFNSCQCQSQLCPPYKPPWHKLSWLTVRSWVKSVNTDQTHSTLALEISSQINRTLNIFVMLFRHSLLINHPICMTPISMKLLTSYLPRIRSSRSAGFASSAQKRPRRGFWLSTKPRLNSSGRVKSRKQVYPVIHLWQISATTCQRQGSASTLPTPVPRRALTLAESEGAQPSVHTPARQPWPATEAQEVHDETKLEESLFWLPRGAVCVRGPCPPDPPATGGAWGLREVHSGGVVEETEVETIDTIQIY